METSRGNRRAGGATRPPGPVLALRSILAVCVALALVALATSSSGADPHGDVGPAPVVTRADGGYRVPTPAPSQPQGSVVSVPTSSTAPAQAAADLQSARAEESAAAGALAEAQIVLEQAGTDQVEALAGAVAAQEALMSARVRLGDLIAAEDAAVAERERAVARVEAAKTGSEAHDSAFTAWQMAAVAERAAHARRTIAKDLAFELFTALQGAEAALAQAEIALGDARVVHRRAERKAVEVSARVAQLEAMTAPVSTSPDVAEPARVRP